MSSLALTALAARRVTSIAGVDEPAARAIAAAKTPKSGDPNRQPEAPIAKRYAEIRPSTRPGRFPPAKPSRPGVRPTSRQLT